MAQIQIDSVLALIERNNFRIKADSAFNASENLRARTGISLYNPVVEYDYMKGSPENAGNQTDFTAIQSFDFPSVYFKKRNVADAQSGQFVHKAKATRQDVLLEAKEICLDIIYHNKLKIFLDEHARNAQKLVDDFQKRLEKGEGNILDLNKGKLVLFEVNREVRDNQVSLVQLNQRLTEMNGGKEIMLTDTTYPLIPVLPPFEQLEKDFEQNDPIRLSLESEVAIAKMQVGVARANRLPKMEVGYHYQGILGQTFSGFHSGISIPLWENKNTVKHRRSAYLYAELELLAHKSEHYTKLKNQYDKYLNLISQIDEFQTLLSQSNTGVLLSKALSTGHISTIEYFMEMSLYRNSMKGYLMMENELQIVVSNLLKYKLNSQDY